MLIAHPGSLPEPSTTHEGNFYTCHRPFFSDYSDQSLTPRPPEKGISTSITQALHLTQPRCATSLSMDTIYDITLAIYHNHNSKWH